MFLVGQLRSFFKDQLIVQLSKKLSIFSVIEGVETSEDDLLVKEIN